MTTKEIADKTAPTVADLLGLTARGEPMCPRCGDTAMPVSLVRPGVYVSDCCGQEFFWPRRRR